MIDRVALTAATVLIVGESGRAKTLRPASSITSAAAGTFQLVNMAAIPRELPRASYSA